jgi:hypothetical protein
MLPSDNQRKSSTSRSWLIQSSLSLKRVDKFSRRLMASSVDLILMEELPPTPSTRLLPGRPHPRSIVLQMFSKRYVHTNVLMAFANMIAVDRKSHSDH